MEVQIHFFDQTWGVFNQCFFTYSFTPFFSPLSLLDCHYVYVCILDGVPWSNKLCSFFFIVLPFCFSAWIISVELYSNSVILSSSYSNLLRNISNFSFQLLYLLAPECLIWFFLIISISLLIFYICWDITLPVLLGFFVHSLLYHFEDTWDSWLKVFVQ